MQPFQEQSDPLQSEHLLTELLSSSNELHTKSEVLSSTEFMLQEYNVLLQRFQGLRSEGVNRLNFFITVTSAILGGIIVLGSGTGMPPLLLKSILLAALLLLSAIGFDICEHMVSRDRVCDRVERAMTRIRRYFVEKDPQIISYLLYPIHDEPTSYLKPDATGARRTAYIFQSFTVGLTVGILMDLIVSNVVVSIIAGVAGFTGNFIFLNMRARQELNQARSKAQSERKYPKVHS